MHCGQFERRKSENYFVVLHEVENEDENWLLKVVKIWD